MALVVENCYQLSINGTFLGGRPFANVFHVQPLGAGAPTVQEAAESMFEAYGGPLMGNMQNTVKIQSCSYVDLSSSTGDSGTFTGEETQGAANGSAVPPNTSVLVKWTATGGRSQRSGRSFLPGADESSVDGAGLINSPTVLAWQSNVDDFVLALQNADLGLVIVSKSSPTAGVARTVLAGTVQSTCATQRRRLRS